MAAKFNFISSLRVTRQFCILVLCVKSVYKEVWQFACFKMIVAYLLQCDC